MDPIFKFGSPPRMVLHSAILLSVLIIFVLCLISYIGLMNIDIELKDQTLNFTVSPVHAAIIMQFQEQGIDICSFELLLFFLPKIMNQYIIITYALSNWFITFKDVEIR